MPAMATALGALVGSADLRKAPLRWEDSSPLGVLRRYVPPTPLCTHRPPERRKPCRSHPPLPDGPLHSATDCSRLSTGSSTLHRRSNRFIDGPGKHPLAHLPDDPTPLNFVEAWIPLQVHYQCLESVCALGDFDATVTISIEP